MRLNRRIFASSAAALWLIAALFTGAANGRPAAKNEGRIFLMMVWDGLRPDLINARDTPNVFALEREGVLFSHHHAVFPTITMVNAAALATGSEPDNTGIFDDWMYFRPALGAKAGSAASKLGLLLDTPVGLENSIHLATLNDVGGFDGYLVGVEGVAQQIIHRGGYVAIIGKQGATFLFDDQADRRRVNHSDYLFVADDLARPDLPDAVDAAKLPIRPGELNSISDRDKWFAKLVVSRALPAARIASLKGHPALIVFWQHNPDLVQHIAGLGTQPSLNALHQCDANLGGIRSALARLGIAHRTDLMVVSDHGFATIRMSISLADLLVSAGIKKSSSSTDIVVAHNGGNDLVYLSSAAYESEEAKRAKLARIVDFAEAQEWCGPIFSKKPAPQASATNRQNRLGWIPGTFAQQALGLYNARRSPDLIISLKEIPDLDNRELTGPANPAFVIGAAGQAVRKNASLPLIRPVPGAVYSDSLTLSTGQGMHGAAGAHELQAFCAATGPDFRRHFIDPVPSGNTDVAPTIRRIFNLAVPAVATGRVLREAVNPAERAIGSSAQTVLTSYLVLQGQEVVTKLRLIQYDGRDYLDDASVTRAPLNGSP
ncbi:MAG: alkaline phosphatase family protein [Deltaproteobacteria bacterium]|nr:alkaline phosphatase family protein [Deltaproteobacteria bacterium]